MTGMASLEFSLDKNTKRGWHTRDWHEFTSSNHIDIENGSYYWNRFCLSYNAKGSLMHRSCPDRPQQYDFTGKNDMIHDRLLLSGMCSNPLLSLNRRRSWEVLVQLLS
jgi:hypothetical protein